MKKRQEKETKIMGGRKKMVKSRKGWNGKRKGKYAMESDLQKKG